MNIKNKNFLNKGFFYFTLFSFLLYLLSPFFYFILGNMENGSVFGGKVQYNSDRDYEWYSSQYNTGEYWYANCAHTCVRMGMMFQNNVNVPSVEEIREFSPQPGTGWYLITVFEAFNHWGYKTKMVKITSKNQVKRRLINTVKSGDIAMVVLNIKKLTYSDDPDSKYNIYFKGYAHYVIIKGLSEDGKWFIVHDPWNDKEGDIGKDRFYSVEEVSESVESKSFSFLIINKNREDSFATPIQRPFLGDLNGDRRTNVFDLIIFIEFLVYIFLILFVYNYKNKYLIFSH
jgi:hypothetical protein